jgi:hypothetical protein
VERAGLFAATETASLGDDDRRPGSSSGSMRSIAGKISRRDEPFAGHDNPSLASELDTLDTSRPWKKIALANLALAITPADQRDVIACVKHNISAQKRSWPFD